MILFPTHVLRPAPGLGTSVPYLSQVCLNHLLELELQLQVELKRLLELY